MANADKVNILVVDDLPDKLLALVAVLESLGQNVITARSGREALRRLLEQEYAVILLDVHMPDIDGFETAALIRQHPKCAHTPIIFITAFSDDMHAIQGYSLGAVDYILSPVVPEILRTKVGVFVELFRKTEQAKRLAEERVALAREQAARAVAEEATRRSTFLAEASTVLASTLDFEATPRALARLAVPFLGDLSVVTMFDDQGHPQQTELAWIDSDQQPHEQTLGQRAGLSGGLAEPLQRVLATGTPEHLEDLGRQQPAPPAWEMLTLDRRGERPLPHFPLKAVLVLPLRARGRTLGVLMLAMGHSQRRYGPAERALAEDLAGRAAIAMDNARLYQNIQENDQRKNEFLAMLAHELRNPLAPIRTALQIMQLRAADEPDLQAIRDMIERQVQHLVRLVDDLLDISRITRGKIKLQMQPVDLASVVHRAVETSRPLIELRQHELTVAVPPESVRVQADPIRLAQVVGNLLNNAAKYTEEGGRIWLTVERAGDEAVLRVRDTGMGIPPDMLSSVFDLFTQVDRSLDRSQGGLGIGLTLVRRLVEMHGGTVQVFSAGANQGSEFVVRLPALAEAPLPERPTNGVHGRRGEGQRRRVLVVDDNVDAAESLAMLLRLHGHEVCIEHDGPGALKAVEAFGPEVVLLDIGLPGMDGYEVARSLRQRPTADSLLLVALTGYGREEDQARSQEAGFHHHLVKPIDPDVLQQLLAEAVPVAP